MDIPTGNGFTKETPRPDTMRNQCYNRLFQNTDKHYEYDRTSKNKITVDKTLFCNTIYSMSRLKDTLLETKELAQEIAETYSDDPFMVAQMRVSTWNLDRFIDIVDFGTRIINKVRTKSR